jgi:hypothetical protein
MSEEEEVKLVSTVPVARRSYVQIANRETGKGINLHSDSTLAHCWCMMTPNTKDHRNDERDCLTTEDKDHNDPELTRAI